MSTKAKKYVLDDAAEGWGKFEPMIIGYIAANLPFAARGSHGNGKTTVGTMLSYALTSKEEMEANGGDTGVRYFSCDKANQIVLGGIPDIEQSRKFGSLQYLPSRSTVIGPHVKAIILDELTRAPKDTQNYLLEIIESKSFNGVPLNYQFLMATMNPETYKGAIRLDAALMDRFAGVLPIDDLSGVDCDTVEKMISININSTNFPVEHREKIVAELRPRIANTKIQYKLYMNSKEVVDRVRSYVAQLTSLAQAKFVSAKGDDCFKLSGREMGNLLWKSVIAIAAYYKAVNNWSDADSLSTAAEKMIEHGIMLKHQLNKQNETYLRTIHAESKFILMATMQGEAGKIQFNFAKASTINQKIEFWRSNVAEIIKHLDNVDRANIVEATYEKIRNMQSADKATPKDEVRTFAEFYGIIKPFPELAEAANRIECSLLCKLIHGIRDNNCATTEPFASILAKNSFEASEISDLLITMLTKVEKK